MPFKLTRETFARGVRYRLFNNGKVVPASGHRKSSGTGLSYIETRLEQWQPNKWKLSSNSVKNGWETVIELCDVDDMPETTEIADIKKVSEAK